jgi:polygalacturonase
MRAVEDKSKFPVIDILVSLNDCMIEHFVYFCLKPSVGHDYDTNGHSRYHPFVFAVGGNNITITGKGVIDGAGAFWWSKASREENHGIGRPHLLELQGITDVEVTGVTLLNSAFWTFHLVYCKEVHVHHMEIQVPWESACCGSGFNGDGIDVDSSQDVLIDHNYINCGDDHFTILSGVGQAGKDYAMPSKNITIVDNKLGSGMGMSVGSSVSGGIEDVLYARNYMNETAGQWGMGIHIKTRTSYGGYIRNIVFQDNYFENAGIPGGAIHIDSGYQSGHGEGCNFSDCTDIRDIVFRNLTFLNAGGTGGE